MSILITPETPLLPCPSLVPLYRSRVSSVTRQGVREPDDDLVMVGGAGGPSLGVGVRDPFQTSVVSSVWGVVVMVVVV